MVMTTDAMKGNQFQSNQFFPNLSQNQNPLFEIINNTTSSSSSGRGTNLDAPPSADSHDDDAFSDLALSYINQMLMDEDDKVDNFHEYAELLATEKPFYEILGQKYPPSPIQPPLDSSHSSDDSISPNDSYPSTSSFSRGISIYDFPEYKYLDGVSDLFDEGELNLQFMKGEEEALKFLPSETKFFIDLEAPKGEVKLEKEDREFVSRVRKNPHGEDFDLEEGRSAKHSAISLEERTLRPDEFDTLLCYGDKFPKTIIDIREAIHIKQATSSQSKRRSRGKKEPKKEVVDLRTILIQCAQMVAADDRRSTSESLKLIRQNSSPSGDGSQRLAHYFANGLEARLAGTGSEIYNLIKMKRRTATDYLKAYQLYLAVCPFKKMAHFFSNQHIMDISEKATRVHIIDYGIGFGFQWPSLIQRMSLRAGGAPKIRITGIDFPQPGFRPRERLDETGRRLKEYAEYFKVEFEYKGISSRWEDVTIDELDIHKDEVLVVNSLFNLHLLADETVAVDCPRNTVLNSIRKMNPDVFIQGAINGSYSAPFFVTRFREALFFFSAMFDMLETNVPREDEQRQLIEREMFGREIMNIIACEGLERVERPETYKQWQVRNIRAGFMQKKLGEPMVSKAKDKVKSSYHKDFIIDEDGRWLLQGWKGRILVALSSWKPNHAS